MKNLLVLFTVILMISSCTPAKPLADNATTSEIKPPKNDDGEWDLDVLDSRYSYFLNAVAKPISQYSESYLKSRNAILVSEWNSYYFTGKYRNVIESSIDYNPQENYGINFEYKLFQVFVYVQWNYRLRMNALPMSEVR